MKNALKMQVTKGLTFATEGMQKVGAEGFLETAQNAMAQRLSSTSAGGPTKVRYFLSGSGDRDMEGKTFELPLLADQVTLGLVRDCFPLKGQFSFRFQHPAPHGRGVLPLKECAWGGFVWVDLDKDSDRVPFYEGQIVMKAEKQLDCTLDASVDMSSKTFPPSTTGMVQDLINVSTTGRVQDLINLDDTECPAVVNPQSPLDPIVDVEGSSDPSFFTAQQESNLQAELDCWALTENASLKDIKVLLTTMHQVLGENSKWTPVNLSDLVMHPNSLKEHVRKAILVSHPDKHHFASAEQQCRAKRIFQALNDAKKTSLP